MLNYLRISEKIFYVRETGIKAGRSTNCRYTTQSVCPVLDSWWGTDLSLQWVRSGTDELLYLPLQGGLRDYTHTQTNGRVNIREQHTHAHIFTMDETLMNETNVVVMQPPNKSSVKTNHVFTGQTLRSQTINQWLAQSK